MQLKKRYLDFSFFLAFSSELLCRFNGFLEGNFNFFFDGSENMNSSLKQTRDKLNR